MLLETVRSSAVQYRLHLFPIYSEFQYASDPRKSTCKPILTLLL